MDIREIENTIDEFHKNHDFISGNKTQLTYELLATFEDLCMCTALASVLNPLALRQITNHMDALNQALNWIENCDLTEGESSIEFDISENRYNQCVSFLTEYAYPYSLICSGYISFPRKRFLAYVNGNTVTFSFPEGANASAWNDILREVNNMGLNSFMNVFNPYRIMSANEKLQKKITVEDGQLCYELDSEILAPFIEIAESQWDATKTLPESWRFDIFSLNDYKKVWVTITALCYIHFFSGLRIKEPEIRLKNSLIIQKKNSIADYASSISGVEKNVVESIIDYLTFEPSKRNVDIMYQPFVALNNDLMLITPMLFMGSRAERNLLAVVSSKKDYEHSKEVNDVEDLMVDEIEQILPKSNGLRIIKRKKLGGRLPDIDLGIYDTISNSVLLCELKWFMAADSSKEVYAREDDINHGCEQSEQIMAYAMSDRESFMKQVFEIAECGDVDLFSCVVAKHNIRTQNKLIPVIDVDKLKLLLSKKSINSVFHAIRNHEYEDALPEDAEITFQQVEYGGFSFNIPAICFGSMPD